MGGWKSKGEQQQPLALSRKEHTMKERKEMRPQVHTMKAFIVSMEYKK